MSPNCYKLIYQFSMLHPWLADLAAPIGSQEVVDHSHKWWQLIGPNLYTDKCCPTGTAKSAN